MFYNIFFIDKKFGGLKIFTYLCTVVKQLKNNNYDNTRKKKNKIKSLTEDMLKESFGALSV